MFYSYDDAQTSKCLSNDRFGSFFLLVFTWGTPRIVFAGSFFVVKCYLWLKIKEKHEVPLLFKLIFSLRLSVPPRTFILIKLFQQNYSVTLSVRPATVLENFNDANTNFMMQTPIPQTKCVKL